MSHLVMDPSPNDNSQQGKGWAQAVRAKERGSDRNGGKVLTLSSVCRQCCCIRWHTHALQQTVLAARGGRMSSHENGCVWCESDSAWMRYWATFLALMESIVPLPGPSGTEAMEKEAVRERGHTARGQHSPPSL